MNRAQLDRALGSCFLFDGIDDPAGLVYGVSEIESFPKGSVISAAAGVGIILSGAARVTKTSVDGRTLPMTTLTPGRLFGIAGLFGGDGDGISNVTALSDVNVLFISEEALRRLLCENPTLSMNYIAYLSERIRFLNRKIDAFTAGNAELKLLLFLTGLAGEDGTIELPCSVSECARRLNMGRASFYRALESLERSGAITRDGGLRLVR